LNHRSLGFRLVSFYAVVTSCGFVLLAVLMQLAAGHFLERQFRQASERRASLIARDMLPQIKSIGADAVIAEIKARFTPEATGRFIRLTTAAGSVLYQSGAPEDRSFDPALVPPLGETPAGPASRVVAQADGRSLMVAAAGYAEAGGGSYRVEVGASLQPVAETLHEFLLALVAGFAAAILISMTGCWFLVRRALGPVERIARSAEEITFHNPSQRLHVSRTGDEIERLSGALNRMLTRLEESYQQTKRFSADASHELRTPLAIIRGELEALARSYGTDTEMRDALGSILEEVDRMAKIVENLLALARLDAGEGKSEWATVDFSELASSTAEQMCLLAVDKGVAIRCETPEPVKVAGDRSRLKQVIVNLLDNAIKFTPSGGVIQIITRETEGFSVLEVADNGVGIPADALPRVFDRFYRADKARSHGQGGAGIGLSIVKSIVLVHGGEVRVEPNQPAGSRFIVQLPLARAANGRPALKATN
jgi:heavy metal sensor kinase